MKGVQGACRLFRFGVCVLVVGGVFLGSFPVTAQEAQSIFREAANSYDPLGSFFEQAGEAESFYENSPEILLVSMGGNARSVSSRRFSVGIRTFSWRDPQRRRTVPVKVFYPAIQGNERFPVIVFSHGLGGSYDRCSYLGRAWAARGFVAVLVQHPGSDEQVWKGKIRILNELREAYKTNWSGRTRANDIRFVLDRLEQLVAEEHWIASKLDLKRIGVGGYDLGALASLLMAGQTPPDHGPSLYDARVGAVLAMSPPVNRPQGSFRTVYGAVEVPAFFISGTEDDGIIGSTQAHQRRIPFDAMSGNDRYLVVLQGADHQIYGGHFLSLMARNDKTFQSAIVRASSCFWQAHLGGDAQAMDRLNGAGLRGMLGNMARIERRLNEAEVLSETIPAETPAPQEVKKTGAIFPVTRYYREIAAKYGFDKTLDEPVELGRFAIDR